MEKLIELLSNLEMPLEEKAQAISNMAQAAAEQSAEELQMFYAHFLRFYKTLDISLLGASLIYKKLDEVPENLKMVYLTYRRQLKAKILSKPGFPLPRKQKWVTLLEL